MLTLNEFFIVHFVVFVDDYWYFVIFYMFEINWIEHEDFVG